MGTVTTITTASHRYYRRKAKRDLYLAIESLSKAAGVPVPDRAELEREDRDRLATRCMKLHHLLPSES